MKNKIWTIFLNFYDVLMLDTSSKRKGYPGISRIDSKHTHGWYVRVYANGGVLKSKLFSDRLFGGKQQALDNAIKFRDHYQMVAALHKSNDFRRKPFYNQPYKNNFTILRMKLAIRIILWMMLFNNFGRYFLQLDKSLIP